MDKNAIFSKLMPSRPEHRLLVTHGTLAIVVFIFIATLTSLLAATFPYSALSVLLLGFFCTGMIHYVALNQWHKWEVEDQFKQQMILSVGLSLLAGLIVFICLLSVGDYRYIPAFVMVPVYFLMPVVIGKMLFEAETIPAYLPPSIQFENIEEARDNAVFAKTNKFVKFIFSEKIIHEKDIPSNGNLGYAVDTDKIYPLPLVALFKTYLLRYNYVFRETNPPVQFAAPFVWSFYVKRKFLPGKRYLDPSVSLSENGIFLRQGKDSIKGVIKDIFKAEIFVERTINS